MMIHPAHARGVAEHGWLHSRFSFSFAQYHDPHRMGFGALRVLNDDMIEPSGGFATHPHRHMEIITIVLEGTLIHRDSMGHEERVHAGEVQYMHAGSGIYHSEYASDEGVVRLLQIWILPARLGGMPYYEQRDFRPYDVPWLCLVSPDGCEHSIPIAQEAWIYAAHVQDTVSLPTLQEGRGMLILVLEGALCIDGHPLFPKDEVQLTDTHAHQLHGQGRAIVFDIPMEVSYAT